MLANQVAVNILLDVVVTLDGAGADDGAATPGGAPITILVDRVQVRHSMNTEDHSAGQQRGTWHRLTKQDDEVVFEMKLPTVSTAGVLNLVKNNDLLRFTISAGAGNNITGDGLIADVERDYAGPSTLRLTLKRYGPDLWAWT